MSIMLKTKLTEMLGIRYPIIQAGMGPFSNNNLCVASANAGVLGLLSTSGLFNRQIQPLVYEAFVKSGEASMDDDIPTVQELVDSIMSEAETVVKGFPNYVVNN